jgi:uncharacterized repeat protein (TIGR01451 family)/LPXTG-motif cell wall-anchored protein
LTKVWVNGASGDTATLEADATNAITDLLSTAGSPPASQTVTVYAGEVVDLSEELGASNIGAYGSSLACTVAGLGGVAVDGRSGTYTMPAAAAAVTCTFTNTRLSNTIVLQKAWVDAKQGDSATLSINGANAAPGQAVSTVGVTPTFTDAANAATLTVLTGSTVTLAEALAGTPNAYTTGLACDTATPTPTGPTSGTVQVPSAAGVTTTCTFTNTRRTATVDVTKVLTDPVGGSSFDLTINGTPGLSATTGGVVSPTRTVLVGDAVNIAETANTGSLANFTSVLACVQQDGTPVSLTSNSGIAGTFTVPATAATSPIHCTFTNTRKSAELTLDKAWSTAVDGDTATLTVDPTARPTIANADSVAPGTTPVTMTVYAGEAVSLQEAMAALNVGGYAPSLSCTQPGLSYTDGLLSGTYTVPSTPAAVTCTFTNTRTTAKISLAKAWTNAKAGDEVDLTIASPTAGPVGATSTAPTGAETAEITVLTGETVNLGESFAIGDAANYVTSLDCASAANLPAYTPDATSGTLLIAKADAGDDIVCTFTNGRGTAEVVVAKELNDPLTPQADFDLSINGSVVFPAAQDGDASSPVEVNLGDEVTVAEEVNVSFDSTLACVDENQTTVVVTPNVGTSGTFVVPASAADETITCTFTNSRKSAPLTLQKVWVDGFGGDTAELSIDGINDDSASSTAPAAPDATNRAVIDIYAGETVALAEELLGANVGSYASALTCTEPGLIATPDGLSGTYTAASDLADDVTCTFTNTRDRSTLTLQKAWVNGANGDTAELSADGLAGDGTDTSTSDGTEGTVTDAANAVTIDVLSGEQVALEEILGGVGGYTTALNCGGIQISSATTGTYTVPQDPTPVTCTFTNTRRTATLVLAKTWPGLPATGDSVELTADGSSGFEVAATGTSTAPTAGSTTTLTVYTGETVDLTEAFGTPANAVNYATNLTCTNAAGQLTYAPGAPTGSLTIVAGDAGNAITCTFTNTRKSSTMTLRKTWVDGAVDDTAGLTISGDAGASAPTVSTATGAAGVEADLVNTASLTIYAGEAVDLSEVLGNQTGSYASALDCSDPAGLAVANDGRSGTYAVPSTPVPVVCVFTNTRERSTVTVHKTWIDGAVGDTAALTLAGSQPSTGMTSTATGGATQDDVSNTVSIVALSGEEIDVAEVLGGTGPGNTPLGTYGTNLTCTGPGTLDYGGGTTGTVTAPQGAGTSTDCVFTNAAGRGTIIVRKVTAGAAESFTFNGTWAGGSPFTIDAPANGSADESFGGVLEGTYSVVESVPAGWVLTGSSCVETSPAPDGSDTTNGTSIDLDAGESVLCTFTNAQRGPLDVTKTVTSGPTLVSGTTYRVTYDVTITSASYIDETFNLADTLEFGAGITIVAATSSPAAPGWTGVAPNTALVTGGTIPARDSITYTITVDADIAGSNTSASRDCLQSDGEGTGLLNSAVVTWEGGTDADDACAPLAPEADVSVVKVADPAAVTSTPDQAAPAVGWTAVVTNNGPVEAVGVTLDDVVPAAFSGVTASTPTGSCSINGQAVHCDLGTMAAGASITVTINAVVAAGTAAGTYTNVAVVASASPPDPNLANNSDPADTEVTVVAVQPPPPPPTVPPTAPPTVAPTIPPPTVPPTPPVPELLPATGGDTNQIQYLGALVIGLGLLALAITRRRRHSSAQ